MWIAGLHLRSCPEGGSQNTMDEHCHRCRDGRAFPSKLWVLPVGPSSATGRAGARQTSERRLAGVDGRPRGKQLVGIAGRQEGEMAEYVLDINVPIDDHGIT